MMRRSSPTLAGLGPVDRTRILAAAHSIALATRDVLAREGDPARVFYLVEAGHLKLSRLAHDGSEMVIRFAGPGDQFGGIVAVGGATYPFTATASEPTRVLAWSRETLHDLMAACPKLRANIAAQIGQNFNEALTRLQETATERVEQRVARALLRLAAHGGVPTTAGLSIAHPLTRSELAGLVSTSLFTVSRLLARWEADGLIASKHRHITVRNPAALAALAGASREAR
jgi:CRP-like cAMP-binding protein